MISLNFLYPLKLFRIFNLTDFDVNVGYSLWDSFPLLLQFIKQKQIATRNHGRQTAPNTLGILSTCRRCIQYINIESAEVKLIIL